MVFKNPKHLLALLLPASNSAVTSVYFSEWKILFFSYWELWTSSEWEDEHVLWTFTLSWLHLGATVPVAHDGLRSDFAACFCSLSLFLEQIRVQWGVHLAARCRGDTAYAAHAALSCELYVGAGAREGEFEVKSKVTILSKTSLRQWIKFMSH